MGAGVCQTRGVEARERQAEGRAIGGVEVRVRQLCGVCADVTSVLLGGWYLVLCTKSTWCSGALVLWYCCCCFSMLCC